MLPSISQRIAPALALLIAILGGLPTAAQALVGLGAIESAGGARRLVLDGDRLYVASGPPGTRIIDVSEPSAPLALPGIIGTALSVQIADGLLYISGLDRVAIVDNSGPVPVIRGVFDTPGGARRVVVADGLAWVAEGAEGLRRLDVSDPTSPVEQGVFDTPGSAFSVHPVGDLAYVADWGSGLRIVDFSSPSSPQELGSLGFADNARDVQVVGSVAFVAAGEAGLRVVDVSDPSEPAELGALDTPGVATEVEVVGDRAYLAASDEGIQIVDLSDLTAPALLGAMPLPASATDLVVSGSVAYVAAGQSVRVLDVADPANALRVIGSHPAVGDSVDVEVVGDFAYLVERNPSALRVIDVSDPEAPDEVGALSGGFPTDIELSGSLAYVADGPRGMRIVDLSNPEQPVLLGALDFPNLDPPNALGVAVGDGYAYLAEQPRGFEGRISLRVVDVSDPARPLSVGTASLSIDGLSSVAFSGGYVYAVEKTAEFPCSERWELHVIDVSAPSQPTTVGRVTAFCNAQDLAVEGDIAYVSDGSRGLKLIDVSDPTDPTLLSATDSSVGGVEAVGGLVYHLSQNAFRVVEASDPSRPFELAAIALPSGFPHDVEFANGLAYVLSETSGLHMIGLPRAFDRSPARLGELALSPGPYLVGREITATASATGGAESFEYRWWLFDGLTWSDATGWTGDPSFSWTPGAPNSNAGIGVWVRSPGATELEDSTWRPLAVTTPPPITLGEPQVGPGPHVVGTPITATVSASGGSPPLEYTWLLYDGADWTDQTGWTEASSYSWTPAVANSAAAVGVWVRSAGATELETSSWTPLAITGPPPASVGEITLSLGPYYVGEPVVALATPSGGTPPYEYTWLLFDGTSWSDQTGWTSSPSFAWTPTAANSAAGIGVWVRSAGASDLEDSSWRPTPVAAFRPFGDPDLVHAAGAGAWENEAPRLVTDRRGTWVVAWHSTDPLGGSTGPDVDVLYARSTDRGESWSATGTLDSNAGSDTGFDTSPDLATDGEGTWIAAWTSENSLGGTIGDDCDILVSRSTDGGQSWSTAAALVGAAGGDAAFDGFARLSTDGAGTWLAAWTSENPLDGTLGDDLDILVSRSTDAGLSWSEPTALNSNAASDAADDSGPALATDGQGTWVAVWATEESELGDRGIWTARSEDGGLSWTPRLRLHAPNGYTEAPQVVTDGIGTWLAVWDHPGGLSGDADIWVARSTNGGLSWSAARTLNSNAASDEGDDWSPELATDGKGTWLAVWDATDAPGETSEMDLDLDILSARSTDGGLSWTEPEAVNANAATDTVLDTIPRIATDGRGTWLVVWTAAESVVVPPFDPGRDVLIARSLRPTSCGLGPELGMLLPALLWWRRRLR